MKYSIREAEFADFEKLQPIHKEVHDLHVNGRPDIYNKAELSLDSSYFKQLIESDKGVIYVIENNKEIIGFTILRINETPERNTSVKRRYLFMEDLGIQKNIKGKVLGSCCFKRQ